MKRFLPLTVAAAALICGTSRAALLWQTTGFNTVGAVPSTDLDTTLLTSSKDDAVGFFAQLIQDVDGDGIDAASSLSPTGVGGDDVVVDAAWFGAPQTSTSVQGQMNQQNEEPGAGVANRFYYVRVWNAPSRSGIAGSAPFFTPNFTLGNGNEGVLIPNFDSVTGINGTTGKELRYGDSQRVTVPSTYDPANDTITLNFAVVTATPLVVPEPTTAALLGMGVGGIMMALKRRRQHS